MIEDTNYWAARPLNDERKDWIRGSKYDWVVDYLQSFAHPHRELIVRALQNLRPRSLLEVGCNCGPNLLLIKDRFPHIKLAGVDVNHDAIGLAKEALGEAVIKTVDIRKRLPFEEKSYDVVLADAVLMYLNPREIEPVINRMVGVARKAVIIVDWYDKSLDGVLKDGHWVRNYSKLLRSRGLKVKRIRLTQETWPTEKWIKYGSLFVGTR